MSDHDHSPWSDERLARGLRERGSDHAREAFREGLKKDFVQGTIEEPDRHGSVAPGRRRVAIRWAAALVPLAAALLVYLGLGPALRVVSVEGEGTLRIGTTQVELSDRAGLQRALEAESLIEVPEGSRLGLLFEDILLFEATSGTRMTLPPTPHRWWQRDLAFEIQSGEVLIETGPEFAGRELRVRTPEGLIVVTGTLLSIERSAGGTCVCVIEGVAQVGRDAKSLHPVPPGQRRVMLVDGSAKVSEIVPPHRDALRDFHDRLHHRITPSDG